MKISDHPDIARCLRTGYPCPIKPIEPANPTLEVGNEEFAEILEQRMKKGRKSESH